MVARTGPLRQDGTVVHVFANADAVADAAAAEVVSVAAQSRAARGAFRLALSGGETPRRLYRRLAAPPHREALLAASPSFFFADERAVAPDDDASNYRMARETLFEPAGIDAARVHRMLGEARDLDAAARGYEALLAQPLDLLVLGIGADGHTASIFPGSAVVRERHRLVMAVTDSPKPPPRRLTITPAVIAAARRVIVLVTGADKAPAVVAALDAATDPASLPAALVRDRDWLLDEAAASRR